jgi:DNA-binding protein HU-alpha
MVVSEVKPVVTQETLRKKALLDEVAERSGIKRRDAKAALESALEILGEAIAAGQEINLPGFGKLKVTRTKKLANGQIYMSRIRQPIAQAKPATGAGATVAKDPLAEAAE